MKKVIFSLRLLLLGIFISASAAPFVFAAPAETTFLPLPSKNYDTVITENVFLKGGEIIGNEGGNKGTQNFLSELFSSNGNERKLLVRANAVLGSIALIWLVVLGAKFIFAQGADEKIESYKEQFGWIVMGLATIAVAEFISFQVLNPDTVSNVDGLLEEANNSANNFSKQVKIFKTFIQYIIGGIALIKMMMSGYDLITGSEEDENIQNEKNFLQNFFFGGALILMAEVLARIFSATQSVSETSNQLGIDLKTIGGGSPEGLAEATNIAAEQGITEIIGLVNFFLTFAGVCSVLMLVLSSIYYVISFGSDDQMTRAKRMAVTSVLGLVVIISSYTLIRFLIR